MDLAAAKDLKETISVAHSGRRRELSRGFDALDGGVHRSWL
jgi:hypothetical protein